MLVIISITSALCAYFLLRACGVLAVVCVEMKDQGGDPEPLLSMTTITKIETIIQTLEKM
jgi:hypothetical protein